MYQTLTIPGGMPGPLGATTGPDLIQIYADTKNALGSQNGVYDQRSRYTGKGVPKISWGQVEQYWTYWLSVWQRLTKRLAEAGRPTSSIYSAWQRARLSMASWRNRYQGQKSYRFVSFGAADDYFQFLGRFVQEIDAGVWFGYNTETDWENAMESLDWVSANPLLAIKKTGEAVSSAASDAWDKIKDINDRLAKEMGDAWMIMKWGSAAIIAAYAYQIATKEKRP